MQRYVGLAKTALIRIEKIGNRSSVDDSRSDGPEDETTVVEPDQGNGEQDSMAMGRAHNADRTS